WAVIDRNEPRASHEFGRSLSRGFNRDDSVGCTVGTHPENMMISPIGVTAVFSARMRVSAITGHFLVGRFVPDSVELLDRQTAIVEVSREHSDYFVRNLCALRCELRAALAVYQPQAFV